MFEAYGFCILLAIIFAWFFTFVIKFCPKRIAPESNEAFFILVYRIYLSSLIGARILFLIVDAPEINIFQCFNIFSGGFSLMGGVIGAFFMIFYMRVVEKKKNFIVYTVLGALMANTLGRIGCSYSNCCSGVLHFNFFGGSFSIPTQLVGSIWYMFVFILIYFYAYFEKEKINEDIFIVIYGISITVERFFLDPYRYDYIDIFYDVTKYQIIAIIFMLFTLLFFITLKFAMRKKE